MAWHVVGAFVGVGKMRIVIWDEAIHKPFQVVPGAGVGIFHEYKAAARVSAKNGYSSVL